MFEGTDNDKGSSFFRTSFGEDKSAAEQRILEKKKDLGQYVSKLDTQINKALCSQNKAMNRKRQQLIRNLNEVKQKARAQTEKARLMQDYFIKNCENILKGDINKWDDNKNFFKELFDFYEQKAKQKRMQNELKKKKIEEKTKRIKELMREQRQVSVRRINTETTITLTDRCTPSMNITSKTLKSVDSGKIKTQASLPALCRKRLATLDSQHDLPIFKRNNLMEESGGIKNYMKAIKTEKSISHVPQTTQISQFLTWYKNDRRQSTFTWFEKLIFVDRNFKKIIDVLK